MKITINTLLIILYLLSTACATHSPVLQDRQFPIEYSLNGQWDFAPGQQSYDPTKPPAWEKSPVPSNWYQQGYDIQQAIYRRHFGLSRTHQNQRITLVFGGVDYFTKVKLNGKTIGEHEGYFQHFSFDITSAVHYDRPNELVVYVSSPHERPEDYSLDKKLIKGIFSHHDTRPGNAWSPRGQERSSGGIWNDVSLHISNSVRISSLPVQVKPSPLYDDEWLIKAKLNYTGTLPPGSRLEWQVQAHNHTDQRIWKRSKAAARSGQDFQIRLSHPALWWPTAYGSPNLYRMTVRLTYLNRILDQQQLVVGIRQIAVDPQQIWSVNGRRLLLKGTNYIGTQWLSEMTEADYRRDIRLMLNAHINVVRVHAHITDPLFYTLCDEMGLMVWQDFPLQWGYADTPEVHQSALSQLDDMLTQFSIHPSIIQWTLHNEPPWDSPWMKYKYPGYRPDQNKELDEKLYQRALSLEKTRPVQKLSAGIEHPWFGWYSGSWLDYAKPARSAWVSEFGAQALPNRRTVESIFPTQYLWPDTDEEWELWRYHNFQKRETFTIAKVPMGNNLDQLIHNTQQYQARLIQLAAESYRRQSYKPVGAVFQFMFVENWPSINWGILDYKRKPKPGYHALKTAYAPLLPSLEWDKVSYQSSDTPEIGLWALNDSDTDYHNARYEIALYQADTLLTEQHWFIDIPADSHRRFYQYRPDFPLPGGNYRLVARIYNQQRQQIAENNYTFAIEGL